MIHLYQKDMISGFLQRLIHLGLMFRLGWVIIDIENDLLDLEFDAEQLTAVSLFFLALHLQIDFRKSYILLRP